MSDRIASETLEKLTERERTFALATATSLTVLSCFALLMFQKNKQLTATNIEQRKQLFLLTSIDKDLQRAEAEDDDQAPDSPRSDPGSVSSTSVVSPSSKQLSVSSNSSKYSHNPYIEDLDRPRNVNYSVRLLSPVPSRRMRSASESVLSSPIKHMPQVLAESTDASGVIDIESPMPGSGKRIAAFSKSASYYEVFREETPSLSGPEARPGAGHAWTALGLEQPLVIAMVGLPARGKSYLVKMMLRYLKWTGFECKVFNVGNYRRKVGLAAANSDFFDASNSNNQKIREHLAMAVQESMYSWLHERGQENEKRRIAIFDATNTTKDRRLALQQRARKENVFLLFVESICDDENVLRRNYELKLQNDDYKGIDPEIAMRDFMSRVQAYEKVYETIDDEEDGGTIAYIKLINVGQKVITRNCHGYLPSQVAFYLQNVHIYPRKIYLSVVAESVESISYEGRIPGQESGVLTDRGTEYTHDLAEYLSYESKFDLVEFGKEILVLSGTGNIHHQSVSAIKEHDFKCFHTPLLNELRGGDLHGYSRSQVKERFPVEYEKRMADKLNYRYPGVGGESYSDVMERVRPVIIELERQKRSIVIVCHIAVLRCIYAYFMGVPLTEMPYKDFEYHRIYELTPGPFGCACSIIQPHANS